MRSISWLNPNARQYRIIIPEGETTDGEIYFAAQEFQLLFAEATGETIEIVTDAELASASDGKFISLGGTALFEATGLSTSAYNLGENGFWLKTVDDDLYIVADEAYGVLFGVYGYLERAFNFDCFTADCYTIDEENHFYLAELDEADIPSIAIRNCGNRFILSDKTTLRRMRYTGRDSSTFVGSASAHTAISYYLPVETYGAHTAWYSSDQTQLCYAANGNQTEYEAMLSAVLSQMKADARANTKGNIFVFSSEDHMTWCSCSTCTAALSAYGSNAGVQIKFLNDLAAGLREWMATDEGTPYARDFKIMFLAYNKVLEAPQNIEFDENLMVAFAPIQMDYQHALTDEKNEKYYNALLGWREVCPSIGFYTYQSNYNYMLAPFDSFDMMADFYKEAALSDGYWMFDLGHRDTNDTATGWQVLKGYLSSKLGWYAGEDLTDAEHAAYIEKLTDDFFANYFGEAAESMRAFYDSYRLAAATAADVLYSEWDHSSYGVQSVYRNPIWNDREDNDCYGNKYFEKETLDSWLSNINAAIASISALKTTDEERYNELYDRIILERISVYYMMAELYPTEYTNIDEIKAAVKTDCAAFGIEIWSKGSLGTKYVADLWTE